MNKSAFSVILQDYEGVAPQKHQRNLLFPPGRNLVFHQEVSLTARNSNTHAERGFSIDRMKRSFLKAEKDGEKGAMVSGVRGMLP